MVSSLSASIPPERHKSGYPVIISTLASDKAWRIPVVSKVRYNGVISDVSLSSATCIADQGSDINVVTQALVDLLHLKTYLVSDGKSNPLGMATSDGSITALRHFAILQVGVLGIWREVHAFILPKGSLADKFLLLGLPWLHDVRATFDIQASRLNIGDFQRGEKHTRLEGPKFQLLKSHKLLLVPTADRYRKVIGIAESSTLFTEPILPEPELDYPEFNDSDSDIMDSASEDDYESSDSALVSAHSEN